MLCSPARSGKPCRSGHFLPARGVGKNGVNFAVLPLSGGAPPLVNLSDYWAVATGQPTVPARHDARESIIDHVQLGLRSAVTRIAAAVREQPDDNGRVTPPQRDPGRRHITNLALDDHQRTGAPAGRNDAHRGRHAGAWRLLPPDVVNSNLFH